MYLHVISKWNNVKIDYDNPISKTKKYPNYHSPFNFAFKNKKFKEKTIFYLVLRETLKFRMLVSSLFNNTIKIAVYQIKTNLTTNPLSSIYPIFW